MLNDVRLRALDTVKRIVFDRLAGHPARVYLFGSCARGRGCDVSRRSLTALPTTSCGTPPSCKAEELFSRLPAHAALIETRVRAKRAALARC